MLIGQDVLRLLTCQALLGRTWAGDRVFDSPAQPADLMIADQREKCFISVYTDDADIDLNEDTRESFYNPNSKVYLLIECAVADKIVAPPNENGAAGAPGPAIVAHTDSGLEFGIGFLAHQVVQALLATDNKWSELWRTFTTPGRNRVEVRRGGPGQQEKQSAIRFASRIMRMQLSILADPVYGEGVPEGFWQDFFDTIEEDDDQDLQELGKTIRAHFETAPLLPSWRIEQKRGTYTRRGLHSLGIAPPRNIWSDEAEPPQLTEIVPDQVAPDVAGGPMNGGGRRVD